MRKRTSHIPHPTSHIPRPSSLIRHHSPDIPHRSSLIAQERLAAAEARKADVRYPACARPAKPTTAMTVAAPRKLGMLRKMAMAVAGGVLARSVYLLGAKMSGFAGWLTMTARLTAVTRK
mgnify:CR=1 FL=1